MERRSTPNFDAARGGLLVQTMTGGSVALFGACEGYNQIELCADIDHPTNAAKNSIHFAKRSETIDVNWCQTRGLREQYFVLHCMTPGFFLSSERSSCVHYMTLRKLNLCACTPENYSLLSCSCVGTKQSALDSAYDVSKTRELHQKSGRHSAKTVLS